MMGESTGGREGEETWLGGNSPFLSGDRKAAGAPGPGSDLTRTAQFLQLRDHPPAPTQLLILLAGWCRVTLWPRGSGWLCGLGPCLFCVSSLGGSAGLCPFGLGLLALGGAAAFPSWAVPSSPQALISPCSCSSSVGEEADESPPPSFRFLLKDRPLNLKGFLKENFFFFLGVSLGGTSPLASAPWPGGAGSMASPVAPAASSSPVPPAPALLAVAPLRPAPRQAAAPLRKLFL